MSHPKLSVVIATARPQWLASCLYHYRAQSLGTLTTELVIVAEGSEKHFSTVLDHHNVKAIFKPIEGLYGAHAKDIGIFRAKGDYICFWDDDNVFYPHALATLYAAAVGVDIGVVGAEHMGFGFNVLPRCPEIVFGNIDTMNICVRREIAGKVRWADHNGVGTDFAYIKKLSDLGATTRWIDISIGEKLVRTEGDLR